MNNYGSEKRFESAGRHVARGNNVHGSTVDPLQFQAPFLSKQTRSIKTDGAPLPVLFIRPIQGGVTMTWTNISKTP